MLMLEFISLEWMDQFKSHLLRLAEGLVSYCAA